MAFILAEDAAMKALAQGLLVSDEKNASRQVKVWFGYPDVEVRDQTFPFITIDLIDIRPGWERQASGTVVDNDFAGTIAPVSGTTYRYEVPVAFDLEYQLTTYARHPRHDRAIIAGMFSKFPNNRGHLAVPNNLPAPNNKIAYRHMFLETFVKRDSVEGENGNKRILRNVYTVKVMSELPPNEAASAIKQIQTVNLNRNQSGSWVQQTVPAGLQIV